MSQKQRLIKYFVFLVYFSITAFLVALFFTQNYKVALGIAGLDFFVKAIIFLLLWLFMGRFADFKVKPSVLFLTGLSGSGKTTLAKALMKKLHQKGVVSVLLDGDEIRHIFNQDKFDEQSRKKHNLTVGAMASLLEAQGHIVIVSSIAPYEETREEIRGMCQNFIEVYVETNLQVCIDRDAKGLYAKALRGEIKDFTGISAPYFPPKHPDLRIDTAVLSVEESVNTLYEVLKK